MEGLKAMREEANHAAMPTIMNPNNSVEETSSSAPRFDYSREPIVPQNSYFPPTQSYPSGPNNFYPVPPPSYQPPRAFEATPWRSPVAPPRPFEPNPWRSPAAPHRAFEPNPHHSPNFWRSPVVPRRAFEPVPYWRSPVAPPFHGNRCPPPQAWNRPGGTDGYYHPPNASLRDYRGAGSGRGVGPRPGQKYPYPRRGTFRNNPRPGAGRGGGRGRGSHACTSARERPEMFYNKSMIEDPWKLMKPVVRNSVGSEDRLPESVTNKRPRTSETTSNSCSQQSLVDEVSKP